MTRYDVTEEVIVLADRSTVCLELRRLVRGEAAWALPEMVVKPLSPAPDEVGGRAKVTIRDRVRTSFVVEVVEVEPDRRVLTHYVDGDFTGRGIWELEEVPDGTRLRFRWQTDPANWLTKLVSHLVNIPKLHSRVIQACFTRLQSRYESADGPSGKPAVAI